MALTYKGFHILVQRYVKDELGITAFCESVRQLEVGKERSGGDFGVLR